MICACKSFFKHHPAMLVNDRAVGKPPPNQRPCHPFCIFCSAPPSLIAGVGNRWRIARKSPNQALQLTLHFIALQPRAVCSSFVECEFRKTDVHIYTPIHTYVSIVVLAGGKGQPIYQLSLGQIMISVL